MLIARFDPATFALVKLITSFAGFRREFPRQSWVEPVTNEHLVDNGVPARIVIEVAPPALKFGQTASHIAERQADGTWLQVWSVETIAPADAVRDLAGSLVGSYVSMVLDVSDDAVRQLGYLGAVQAREGQLKPTLDDVAGRIGDARSVDEAKAIFDELGADTDRRETP